MTKSLALSRLVWRRATLLAVFPVFLIVMWPGIILSDRFDHGLKLGTPEATTAILWVEAIVLMSFLGGYLGGAAASAYQPLFAFTVPSIRSTLLRQKLIVGLAAALLIGAGVFLAGDHAVSFAAFSCALLFFAAGSSLSDPAMDGLLKMFAAVLVFGAAFEAARVVALFQSKPAALAAVSLGVAAAILYREQSLDSARRRALFQPPPAGYALGNAFPFASTSSYNFESSISDALPASGTILELFKASDFEVFGSRRFGWAKTLLTTLALLCAMAYLSANTSMVGTLGLMMMSMQSQSHRLTGRWPYPVSRSTRANLAFVSALVDCVSYFALGLLIMVLLNASGLPRFEFFRNAASRLQDVALIPVSFIWSPVAIWLAVSGKARTQKEIRTMAAWDYRRFGLFFAAVMLSVSTLGGLTILRRTFSVGVEVAAGITLALIVQATFWFALRRHFATKDLI